MKKGKLRKISVHIRELELETFIKGLRRLQTTRGIKGDVEFPLTLKALPE
jgi:hypothetical protein